MRNTMTTLSISAVCVCAVGFDLALAQSSHLRDRVVVHFCAASTMAQPGFTPILPTADTVEVHGQYFVNRKALFTGEDVVALSVNQAETLLELAVHSGEIGEVEGHMTAEGGGYLAIFVRGRLVAIPAISAVTEDDHVILTGFAPNALEHLVNLLIRMGVSHPAALLNVVQDRSSGDIGGPLTVHVFLAGATGLRAYQVELSATSASTGLLPVADASIDTSRPDYVFASGHSIEAVNTSQGRLGGVLFNGTVDVDEHGQYVGTYSFRVPQDGNDPIYVNFRIGRGTYLRDTNSSPIPVSGSGLMIGDPPSVKRSGPVRSRG